ncbi:MAG: glycoside hydrolase family 3 protein [Sphingobacteriales bacterium]|nr:MAG: glycoside hydrolase family 3 protein [Sphingobacteriales bacterium]
MLRNFLKTPIASLTLTACLLMLLAIAPGCTPKRAGTLGRTKNPESRKPLPDSLDLKIGQMIMMGIGDRKTLSPADPLVQELKQGKLGGIAIFEKNLSPSASAATLRSFISDMQRQASIPLFVTIDEEGGRVHRLKAKYGFMDMPSAAYLGKLDNPDSTRYHNRRLASLLADLGINLNYAPCVDVAVNPDNPVIVKNNRSFSADPAVVTRHASLVIQAHQEQGVRTILKHFPGHGSSMSDSHLGIADVSNTWKPLELNPYREIIASGKCDAVMTAHIVHSGLEKKSLPATLSRTIITGLLRDSLGFNGVVFSDDMQMHAISSNYGFENALALAINAGVDVLMFANNVTAGEKSWTASEAHAAIRRLVDRGEVSRQRIDASYRRIMRLKSSIKK